MNKQFSTRLLAKLEAAESVVVFTGAGMSAESGVPTFRGEDGVWKKFKPEELANLDAFIRNPELVWEWYKHRKHLITTISPNPGHFALAGMERYHTNFSIITQNIDNLHRKAGSTVVHELHGNIERNYCISCGASASNKDIISEKSVPKCALCNGIIRPDVVWFGELLPADEWNAAETAARQCEIFFSVGTSGVVYPAASLPLIAKRSGAYVVELNLEPTDFGTQADEAILGRAGEILPELLRAYNHHSLSTSY